MVEMKTQKVPEDGLIDLEDDSDDREFDEMAKNMPK